MFFAGGPKYQRVEGSMYNVFYIIGVTSRGSLFSAISGSGSAANHVSLRLKPIS
jgi:hypothetical protein